jgi:hypothetical protein
MTLPTTMRAWRVHEYGEPRIEDLAGKKTMGRTIVRL